MSVNVFADVSKKTGGMGHSPMSDPDVCPGYFDTVIKQLLKIFSSS